MTAAQKLSELLSTRPQHPTAADLERWWSHGGYLVTEILDEIRVRNAVADANLKIRQASAEHHTQALNDLVGARAELRREQDARAQLRVELDRVTGCLAKANANHEEFERKWYLAKDQLEKLQLAAPVMLTVMALLADEADLDCVREIALWFYELDPEHLTTWTNAERARTEREKAKAPCCPQSTLPGGSHDIACRGGGKVH